MAQFIKHVGVNGSQKKVVVVFREVPGDPESALVIPTDSLPQLYHDDLIKAIESTNCQASLDPSEYLFRQAFHDGTNMLNTIHQRGWMVKVPTKSVAMTPQPGVTINLVDLNRELKQLSNEQAASNGATRSSDIANNAPSKPEPARNPPGVIDDIQLAAKFRAQANSFEAEAHRLREEAEKLDPKSVVAAVLEKSSPSPATEVKRGRGRPSKKVATV
jgi:hypothetical protein